MTPRTPLAFLAACAAALMTRARLVACVAAIMLPATTARADCFCRLLQQGTAWLHYEASALRAIDDTRPAAPRDLALAGVRVHLLATGRSTFGLHAGLDLAAGSALRPAGLAYDVALFPLGIGARLGRTSVLTLGAGIGALGATTALDDATTFPIEANAELGGRLRILARARVSYIVGAASRTTARNAPFGDELDTTLAIRLGHTWDDFGFPSSAGYFLGISYRELATTRFLGLTIGYSLDASARTR
jgi:hypothetical protein